MSNLHAVANLAWAAGILDGEGCIYIVKARTYHLMFRVCMSDESTVRRLRKIFGGVGSLYSYQTPKKNRKKMWNWACASVQAGDVLETLLPYFWTKKAQAITGISFQRYTSKLKKWVRRSSSEIKKQHSFYIKLREQK